MHKEAFLTTTADCGEVSLPLDAISAKTREPGTQIISVATSFGRAVVASRIPSSDTETWSSGLRHLANDHRYYEITQDSLGEQFEHYYLLLKDHTDKTRAIQPF